MAIVRFCHAQYRIIPGKHGRLSAKRTPAPSRIYNTSREIWDHRLSVHKHNDNLHDSLAPDHV